MTANDAAPRTAIGDALRDLAADLVNDHRGIPYDVIRRLDAVIDMAEAAPPDALREEGIDA